MKELDYNEFSNFFYTNALPVIKPFEGKRKTAKFWAGLLNLLSIIVAIVGGIITIITFMLSSDIGFDFLRATIALYVCLQVPKHAIIKNFQRKIKEKLYKNVFDIFGLKYAKDNIEKSTAADNIRYICDNSQILSYYDFITVDDVITGEYKGLPFALYDADIYYYTGSGRNRRRVTAFRGAFLATKINKNFKGETIIKTESTFNPKTIGSRENVKLEDVEFEKYFETYSTDQIEARYILTTAFMQRLKDFRINKKCPINVLISRRTYMDENIFFFFDTRKDHFEIDISKSLMDKNVIYDVLLEISDMLKVVDALKLDQNIGL